MNKLIILLIRLKFHLKAYERFRFTNQKTENWYYFTKTGLMKWDCNTRKITPSNVKFNWLVDRSCKIIHGDKV